MPSYLIPDTLDVLGHDPKNQVFIWSKINRKLYRCKLNNITMPDLVQMASQVAVDLMLADFPSDENALPFIKCDIAELSRFCEIQEDNTLGVGVWKHPTDDGVVIVTGHDCIHIDGDIDTVRESSTASTTSSGWQRSKAVCVKCPT